MARPSVSPTVLLCIRANDRSTVRSVGATDRSCVRPSDRPTFRPYVRPTARSSVRPSARPSVRSSMRPIVRPSVRLTDRPSSCPCVRPTERQSDFVECSMFSYHPLAIVHFLNACTNCQVYYSRHQVLISITHIESVPRRSMTAIAGVCGSCSAKCLRRLLAALDRDCGSCFAELR